MKRAYIWTTFIFCVLVVCAALLGPVIFMATHILGPLIYVVINLLNVLSTAAFALLCGYPAVFAWPNRAVAAVLALIGLGVFANYTFAVPIYAAKAEARFVEQSTGKAAEWANTTQTAEILYDQRGSGERCGYPCQLLLKTTNVSQVRIKVTADSPGVMYRTGQGDECEEPLDSPDSCLLSTTREMGAPDLILTSTKADDLIGKRDAFLLGLTNKQIWSAERKNGAKIIFAAYYHPVTGWWLTPSWTQPVMQSFGRLIPMNHRETRSLKPPPSRSINLSERVFDGLGFDIDGFNLERKDFFDPRPEPD
ncbi:MAG: hypothetical protein AAF641_16980 [Pseudomonadota bacterium]